MKCFARFAFRATAAVMVSMVPVVGHAQGLPPAADIVAKYVSAIGGKDAIMKVTSIKQTATMEVPSMGLVIPMEVYSAAPNKVATKMEMPGMGTMLNGYNGTVGWDVNPMQGPRLLADKELATIAENADFHGNMLFSADRYASMTTTGDTTINGEKAYKVKMVHKTSLRESVSYFSTTSGLLLGGVSTTESQMGVVEVRQTMSEYKKFGALMIPTAIEMHQGPQTLMMKIQNVEINGAPESAFAVPEQVQPLIKK